MRPCGRQHALVTSQFAVADDEVVLGLVMIELVDLEVVRTIEIRPSHLLDEDLVAQSMDGLLEVGTFHKFLCGKGEKH
jgi:hypothetical protein